MMLLMVGVIANAQRNLTVAVLVVKPAIDTNITTTSIQNPRYLFQNLSATAKDSIQVGDTVTFFSPTNGFSGTSYTSYGYFIATTTIKKDSIVAVNGGSVSFTQIESLYNLTASTLLAKPFTNNTQYLWYLRPSGVRPNFKNAPVATFTPGATDTQRVWINKSTTSVNEIAFENNSFKTYPNPAVNELFFEYNVTTTENVKVRVLDEVGRTLMTKEYDNVSGVQKFDLNIAHLPAGSYILHLTVGEKVMANSFNVQK